MNAIIKKLNNKYLFIFLMIILVLLVRSYYSVFSVFSGDEIFSMFITNSTSFKNLLSASVETTHPNFYHLALKTQLLVTSSVVWLRAFNLIFFLSCIFTLYKIGNLFKMGTQGSLLFLMPFATSLYFFRQTYTLRMYIFGILFFLLSFYFLFKFFFKFKKRFFFYSWAFDLLGVLSVYGYFLWIPIKLVFLTKWMIENNKKNILEITSYIISIVVLFSLVAFSVKEHYSTINYLLDWVRLPVFEDIGLSFINMNGLGYFRYFELPYDISTSNIIFGIIISILIIVYTLLSIPRILFILKNRLIVEKKYFQIFEVIFIFCLIILISMYSFSNLLEFKFFHIRQFFVIATSFSIYFGSLMYKNRGSKLIFLSLIYSIFFIVNIRSTAYLEYWKPFIKNEDLVLANERDVELGYYYCDSHSFEENLINCPKHNIYFDFDQLKDNSKNREYFFAKDEKYKLVPPAEAICEFLYDGVSKCSFLR